MSSELHTAPSVTADQTTARKEMAALYWKAYLGSKHFPEKSNGKRNAVGGGGVGLLKAKTSYC